MKLARVAIFAAGYVIGAKAGRERYAQIAGVAERAAERLDEFSSRHPPGDPDDRGSRGAAGGP